MVKDFSEFLPQAAAPSSKSDSGPTLESLGWQPFFSQQIDADDLADTPPVRVTSVHRSGLACIGVNGEVSLPPRADVTVGDWLMFNSDLPHNSVLLDRTSVVKRRAAGHDRQAQLIAANIDTGFIVTSCNQDFNVARLERYIVLLLEAEITPVIILTKVDLADDVDEFFTEASNISDLVQVVALDARGDEPKDKLAHWIRRGQTVAFMGSSGVGKSTLTNSLLQDDAITTQSVRKGDGKGRHTTTSRELHFAPNGCAVLDTPGMRELQVTDAFDGIEMLFGDIVSLAQTCKFNDCAHHVEPGCAVLAAIENGSLDIAKFERWKKLAAEERHNSASLTERKSQDRSLGKLIKSAQKAKKR